MDRTAELSRPGSDSRPAAGWAARASLRTRVESGSRDASHERGWLLAGGLAESAVDHSTSRARLLCVAGRRNDLQPRDRLPRSGRPDVGVGGTDGVASRARSRRHVRASGVQRERRSGGRLEQRSGTVRAGEGCSAEATEALIRKFVVRYNRGDVAAIDRMWATARFGWFSTIRPGARLGSAANDRATLAAYFRARVRVHERLRVTRLGAGYDPSRHIVNFAGKLVRSADDLRPTLHDFKGATDCSSGGPILIVWSM